MIFMNDEMAANQVKTEATLPPHITAMQVDDAARKYWNAISHRSWTSLEFDMRQRVISFVLTQIALSWALKEAGVA